MKVIVFGATGATGREIVRQAVDQGHSVTAFVRHPEALAEYHEIHVIQGDVFDAVSVADAIAGHSAVFSALGARTLKAAPLLAHAVPNIVAGMQRHYVRRLIVLGAAGIQPGYGKYQSALARIGFWLAVHTILRRPFADQAAQERILAASDLDYTIVRPPRLFDGGKGVYRVIPDALPPGGRRISRSNVAAFMLQQLTDPRFHRQGLYIAE